MALLKLSRTELKSAKEAFLCVIHVFIMWELLGSRGPGANSLVDLGLWEGCLFLCVLPLDCQKNWSEQLSCICTVLLSFLTYSILLLVDKGIICNNLSLPLNGYLDKHQMSVHPEDSSWLQDPDVFQISPSGPSFWGDQESFSFLACPQAQSCEINHSPAAGG